MIHDLSKGLIREVVDSGERPGVSSELAEKMKALEREIRELRQANDTKGRWF